eukprot:g20442.t2
MPLTIAEVKKALSFIWGKDRGFWKLTERDLNETYAFEFNSAWSCVRSNGGESRRFRLSFDASAGRLWWGQSYFMDPDDLLQKPEKVQWYRASDPKKSRAAFVWKRLREAREVAHKSAVPKVATARPAGTRPPSGTEKAPKIYVEKSKRSPEKGQQSPEIMLDLDQVLVIYKPPHWKVELPSNTQDLGDCDHVHERLQGKVWNPKRRKVVFRTKLAQEYPHARCATIARNVRTENAHIRTLRTDATTRSEISASGDWAETRYQVIATYDSVRGLYSLLACDITSGRTHQIRVHMQHLGHPLVSDDKYASETLEEDRAWCPRLFLHCYRLRFKDMRNSVQLVSCPLPSDLKAALSRLGAADGPSNDLLFEETSWQREVFRVPAMAWRPGTEAEFKSEGAHAWASLMTTRGSEVRDGSMSLDAQVNFEEKKVSITQRGSAMPAELAPLLCRVLAQHAVQHAAQRAQRAPWWVQLEGEEIPLDLSMEGIGRFFNTSGEIVEMVDREGQLLGD